MKGSVVTEIFRSGLVVWQLLHLFGRRESYFCDAVYTLLENFKFFTCFLPRAIDICFLDFA